jgi:hypothetical protein
MAPGAAGRGVAPGALLALLCAILLPSPALAGAPSVSGVTPDSGPAGEETALTVTGSGFDPGARASLLGGGPHEVADVRIPSGARRVCIEGDRAYVAYYDEVKKLGGFLILDITEPSSPVELGRFETGDMGRAVAVSGQLAYLSFLNPYTFIGGLHIVDISDLSWPFLIESYFTFVFPTGAEMAGDHVYVADLFFGLQIVDVADPEAPFLAGGYDPPGLSWDLALSDGYAFIADGSAGLQVVDVSQPGTPAPHGSWTRPGMDARSVAVSGSRAFVTDLTDGLLIFDITEPSQPSLLGSFPTADNANDVAVSDDLAFLADGFNGLVAIDVSDPSAPSFAGGYAATGSTGRFDKVTLSGRYAYIADALTGLRVIDIAEPLAPAARVGEVKASGEASSLARSEDTILLAGGTGGVQLIDASDPAAPRTLGQVDTPGEAKGLAVAEGIAFVGDGPAGLQVIDLSGPSLVGGFETSGDARGVDLSGRYLFLADGSPGLRVFDVSTPASPVLLATLNTRGSALDVSVQGGTAYVADDFGGLQIVDVRTPAAPVRVGGFDTPGRAAAVVVDGPLAYIADRNRGLRIIDVSQPGSPVAVGAYPTRGSVEGLTLEGHLLYIADGLKGLQVLDVTDPARPVWVGRYETPGSARDVLVSDGHAFVADGRQGLQVMRLNPEVETTGSPSGSTLQATLPAGFSPGPYDVQVTNAGGERVALSNGFHVCAERALRSWLAPVVDLRPETIALPLAWRLHLDGDETFFDGQARHDARLVLPPLPSELIVETVMARDPDQPFIELVLTPGLEVGRVRLEGDGTGRIEAIWAAASASGGFDLASLDERTYGDLLLAISNRQRGAVAVPAAPLSARGEELPFAGSPARRYRLGFRDGRLVSARAWGRGTDLLFEVAGRDDSGCESRAETSLRTALSELCLNLPAGIEVPLHCGSEPPPASPAPLAGSRSKLPYPGQAGTVRTLPKGGRAE